MPIAAREEDDASATPHIKRKPRLRQPANTYEKIKNIAARLHPPSPCNHQPGIKNMQLDLNEFLLLL
jgi:hypothetical protein